MNNYKLSLLSLLLLIPVPTIVFRFMKNLADSGTISIFELNFSGTEAILAVVLFILLSVSVLTLSLKKLVLSYKQVFIKGSLDVR